jgi:catechol 2,3-dioxygenase-like lactoylglutathione lyase family enzyme
MIDHIILKVSDFKASKGFYLKALGAIGHKASPEFPWPKTKSKGIGFGPKDMEFFIVHDKAVKPSVHVAFRVSSRAKVKAFYKAAMAAGGLDNGAPELSPQYGPNYFSAYVFDPDGHNLEVVCHEAK